MAVVAIRPVRHAAQTLALVPDLMDAGPRPLALVPAPRRESVTYGTARVDRLDVYLPHDASAANPKPAVVFVLGVHRVPLDHPAVVRVATAIARIGLVVAVPESQELLSGRLDVGEAAHLGEAFAATAARDDVADARVGLAGFSAGASLALLVAAEPDIAEDVAWVNAFGAYGDAETLLAEVATRSVMIDGDARAWQPGELTRGVIRELLLSTAGDDEQRALLAAATEPLLADERAPAGVDAAIAARLTGDARTAYLLAAAATHDEARRALSGLSPATRERLAALSPVRVAGRIRSPVFLMHDEGDDAIPVSQLDGLEAALRATGTLREATRFRLFDHVQPDAALGPDALPEVIRLYGHLLRLLDVAA